MEIWKPVKDYEGYYEVSNMGQVRAVARDISNNRGGIRFMPEQILSTYTDASRGGYHYVTLYKEGRKKNVYVHLAVLNAFIGPKPEKSMQGCHDNGDTNNNQLSNLRWDTPLANAADRILHGTQTKGESSNLTVLTADKVREIRRRAEDESLKAIAVEFGISRQQVDRIVKRQRWQHI
jgi:hypothetical protein